MSGELLIRFNEEKQYVDILRARRDNALTFHKQLSAIIKSESVRLCELCKSDGGHEYEGDYSGCAGSDDHATYICKRCQHYRGHSLNEYNGYGTIKTFKEQNAYVNELNIRSKSALDIYNKLTKDVQIENDKLRILCKNTGGHEFRLPYLSNIIVFCSRCNHAR